jgi:hypothetical protein
MHNNVTKLNLFAELFKSNKTSPVQLDLENLSTIKESVYNQSFLQNLWSNLNCTQQTGQELELILL